MQCFWPIISVFICCLVKICILKSVPLELVDCNTGCVCDGERLSVTCVDVNMTAVPANVSVDVRFLNLTANNIRSIDDDDFVFLRELEYIDLSYNVLVNISHNAFIHNIKLRTLSLTHNVLDGGAVVAASKIPLKKLLLAANQINDLCGFYKFSSLSFLDLSENVISFIPPVFLSNLPELEHLTLAGNRIEIFVLNTISEDNHLKHLNLSMNSIVRFGVSGLFRNLEVLDLSWNRFTAIEPEWFASFPNLRLFNFTGNLIDSVPEFAFRHLWYLQVIEMNFLQNLTSISINTFSRLQNLDSLYLTHNPRLSAIDSDSMSDLAQLKHLDLSDNNLSSFHLKLLIGLTKLEFVDLSKNPWSCNCFVLDHFFALQNILYGRGCVLELDSVCGVSLRSLNQSALNLTSVLDCRTPRILSATKNSCRKIGSSALLDCVAVGHPTPQVIWITNRNVTVENSVASPQLLSADIFSQQIMSSVYIDQREEQNRMFVFPNGSLYIAYVTRKEGGVYSCLTVNEFGNDSVVVGFQLDYEIMSIVAIRSMILGFLTAAAFFLIAVILGVARYLAFVCSKKEKKKRKGIREVLESIHDYKAAQIDRFSAYRMAKMGQLSAFKSAKIDQLSAFKHARVGKLRTYKQATVTSILHYLERMREHYANQTARIKDNCAQQMEKLCESYDVQRGKLKDYRSHHVERIRDNYNAQVLKVREYGIQQMSRLREQYKSQQQNVLKLLELLDIGNCVTVIEAECMHTESVIFDASIAFDFEAHAIHLPRDNDSSMSDESHYLTASESGSTSNDNIPLSVSCSADIESHARLASDSIDNSNSDLFFESLNPGDIVLSSMFFDDIRANVAELERETEC